MGNDWLEHGAAHDRLGGGQVSLIFAAQGRVVIATRRGSPDRVLECVDVASGRVHRGGPVTALAIAGEQVVSASTTPGGASAIVVHRLPDLQPESTHEIEAPVMALDALAREDRAHAIVAATTAALVLVDRAGAVRRVALADVPTAVRLSPDGRFAAVAGASKTIAIVDLAAAAVVTTLRGARAPIATVCWTPGGEHVVASAGKALLVWPVGGKAPKARTILRRKHDVALIGCTAGGLVLALSYLEPLVALDPVTGSEVWSVDQYGPHAIEGDRVISVRFQELRELDGATGAVRRSLASLEFLQTVAIHGDAIAVATRGARVQYLPRTATEWPARRGSGHDEEVLGVSFAGERFATTGFDSRVVVWERGRAEPIVEVRPLTTEGVWPGHAVHLAGDELFTTFARGVQRWSVPGGALCASIERLKDDVTLVLPVPEHGLLIAASEATRRTYGELYFLDLETLAIVHEVRLERTYRRARRLDHDRVELTGALARLVIDAGRRAIVERDALTTPDLSRTPHVSEDRSLLVEVDTRPAIAHGPARGWLHARELVLDRELYARVETEPLVGSADLSSCGRLVTPHADGLRIWDARTARGVARLEAPCALYGVRWFPDGETVLCWSGAGALFTRTVRSS